MDVREQRGMAIAEDFRIARKGDTWLVPSQRGNGKYSVRLLSDGPTCTCLDFDKNGGKCKHIHAAELVATGFQPPEGEPHLNRGSAVRTEKRKTYPQDWPAYNRAQTKEKEEFLRLLQDLCSRITQPPQATGRPRMPLSDAIFGAAFKVYSTFSGRRFMTDMRGAHAAGHVSRLPCYNSIFKCLESEEVTPILISMIAESACPLHVVETDFAVDSSGFTTSRFIRWFDHKYGVVRQQHDWVKVHLMCGVKTNIVAAVEIADRDAHDSPLFAPLVRSASKKFTINEVSGDKAYLSVENMNAVADAGGTPFIAFKSNSTPAKGGLWAKMFHYFSFRRDEFLAHYHKRSNVESTFSMIKAKFRDHVRSKTETAMKNEVLCKILCHNICCLISATHELGISVDF